MYKINEIVNRALLVGDKSMPEMYLKKILVYLQKYDSCVI